jgi:subtilisin family serine protease
MSSTISISPGIWKIVFEPISIVTGNIDIYLQIPGGISKDTRFLKSDKKLTVSVPGNANKVINSSAHVTGVVALFMQWGIVQKNDLFLYSQKLKSALVKYANINPKGSCPNNLTRYGLLDLCDINLDSIVQTNKQEIIRDRNLKRKKLTKKYRIRPYVNQATNLRYGINMIHNGELEKDLQKLNIPYRYYKISDNIAVVFIGPEYQNYTSNVLNLPSVLTYQINIRLALLGEISPGISQGVVATEDIGANFFKNNLNVSITGKGVVICIADSGIDYLHEDFIYPDGTSKIRYLWDQTKDGNPPKGYTIGTEYTREDINKAIQNNDSSLSTDEEGHGTMISGICAGLGRKNSEYAGVAEDSELIVVKLGKIEGYYTSANLIAATEYLDEKAYKENIPIIINYSTGSNNLAGRTSVATVGSTFFTRGIYTVSAAGNEGNAQTHTSGKINFKGEIKDIELELSQDEDTIDIEIWIDKPDIVTVALVSPSGEESKVLLESDYTPVIGLFDLEGTEYSITYIYPTTYSGQECIRVNLNKVTKGIWKIRLTGDYITNGIYHAYLPNRVFLKPGTKFREVDPLHTINYPATYDENLTIGAYDTINNSLWVKSSRGPTIAGTYKPDIVAPGVNIIAPYPGNTYATITGTAPAGAYVSGAAALYMQYVLVDGIYPSKSFSQKIKTYLKAGAKRNIDITYPNNSYGYGILDIKGMFEQLK